MKNLFSTLLGILLIGGGGYYAASPYLVVSAIDEALKTQDEETLSKYIDYKSLRAAMKPALLAEAKKVSEVQESDGLLVSFGKTIGNALFEKQIEDAREKIVDKSLDHIVTPQGMVALLSGAFALESFMSETLGGKTSQDYFSSANKGYKGLNEFHINVEISEKTPMALVMKRSGFADWKITGVSFSSSKSETK